MTNTLYNVANMLHYIAHIHYIILDKYIVFYCKHELHFIAFMHTAVKTLYSTSYTEH